MGVLGAVAHSPESLDIDLDWIEAEVGDKPYGVDVIIPASLTGGADGGFTLERRPPAHPGHPRRLRGRDPGPLRRAAAARLTTARTLSPRSAAWATSTPFSADAAGAQLDIALAHRGAFVANALGPPPQYMIDAAKDAGKLVGALAGRAVHAERHQAAGVDIIIAQGYEAGGHTGEIGSMVLIPEIVDAVDVPVLGAGGIGRGRQMAAAMALGAEGVWCGSVWLTTVEAETHPGCEGQDADCHIVGHDAIALSHRQAGPDAQVGLDRGMGPRQTRRTLWACRCSRC